jgi:hypothetical protein
MFVAFLLRLFFGLNARQSQFGMLQSFRDPIVRENFRRIEDLCLKDHSQSRCVFLQSENLFTIVDFNMLIVRVSVVPENELEIAEKASF